MAAANTGRGVLDAPALRYEFVASPPSASDVRVRSARARLVSEEDAPLTRTTAMAASAASAATGLMLMTASTVMLADRSTSAPSAFVMLSLGFVLFNFGPNMADLLVGNPLHMMTRGALRVALLAASGLLLLLGPIGAVALVGASFTWFAWCIADVADASYAPRRWAKRMNGEPADPMFFGLRF